MVIHPSHCALRSHALPLAFDGIMQKIAFPNFAAKLLPFLSLPYILYYFLHCSIYALQKHSVLWTSKAPRSTLESTKPPNQRILLTLFPGLKQSLSFIYC